MMKSSPKGVRDHGEDEDVGCASLNNVGGEVDLAQGEVVQDVGNESQGSKDQERKRSNPEMLRRKTVSLPRGRNRRQEENARIERHGADDPPGQPKEPVEDDIRDEDARQVRDDRDEEDGPVCPGIRGSDGVSWTGPIGM